MEILGAPVVELTVRADRPVAMVAVRLSDVQPDDKATRITYGLLNLTHRDGHDSPAPLEQGRVYPVQVQLNGIAQLLPVGHRLRISVSTSYFPLAWPSPEPVRLTIDTSASSLRVPVRRPRDESIVFDDPASTPTAGRRQLTEERHDWRVIRDLARDVSVLEVVNDLGSYRLDDIDMTVRRSAEEWYSYESDDFTSPSGRTRWVRGLSRGDWSIRTVTEAHLTCDPHHFHLTTQLDAYENDRRLTSDNSHRSFPRNLV